MAERVLVAVPYVENIGKRFSPLVLAPIDLQCVFNDSKTCVWCQKHGISSPCIKIFGPKTELKIFEDELFGTPTTDEAPDDTTFDMRFVPIQPQSAVSDAVVTGCGL